MARTARFAGDWAAELPESSSLEERSRRSQSNLIISENKFFFTFGAACRLPDEADPEIPELRGDALFTRTVLGEELVLGHSFH